MPDLLTKCYTKMFTATAYPGTEMWNAVKQRLNKHFDLEFDKMWIHGYLHLIGYDHKNLNDYKKMLKKEKTILNYIYKKIDK